MEINKKVIVIITVLSFIFIVLMDYVNITQYVDCNDHIDSVIANTITFISILIGFISSIYVMLQQNQKSYVMELLRRYDLLRHFNKSFKILMYVGFFDVFILIFMNLVASSRFIFKIVVLFNNLLI